MIGKSCFSAFKPPLDWWRALPARNDETTRNYVYDDEHQIWRNETFSTRSSSLHVSVFSAAEPHPSGSSMTRQRSVNRARWHMSWRQADCRQNLTLSLSPHATDFIDLRSPANKSSLICRRIARSSDVYGLISFVILLALWKSPVLFCSEMTLMHNDQLSRVLRFYIHSNRTRT